MWAGSSVSTHHLELTSPQTQAVALDLRTSPGSVSLRWNWSEALSLVLLFLSSEKDGGGGGGGGSELNGMNEDTARRCSHPDPALGLPWRLQAGDFLSSNPRENTCCPVHKKHGGVA